MSVEEEFLFEYPEDSKFKLLKETERKFGDVKLYRIQALKEFFCSVGRVRVGSLGGWVDNLNCLSNNGNCWIADEAKVFNGSSVNDDVTVNDDAIIKNNSSLHGKSIVSDRAILDDSIMFGRSCVNGRALIINSNLQGKSYVNSSIIINSQLSDSVEVFNHSIIRNSSIWGGAKISKGEIYQSAEVIQFGNVGSEGGILTIFPGRGRILLRGTRGCFNGTIGRFLECNKRVHEKANPGIYQEYILMTQLAELRIRRIMSEYEG